MNKDNPVPSLERKIFNLINDYEDFFDYREDVKSEIRSKILKLFQNGVETNNEQPIKEQCSCKNPHYGFKTIAICTDCNGIKDDEYWVKLETIG